MKIFFLLSMITFNTEIKIYFGTDWYSVWSRAYSLYDVIYTGPKSGFDLNEIFDPAFFSSKITMWLVPT